MHPVDRADAGFSLVEVLVTLALLSLLLSALFGAVTFGMSTWNRTSKDLSGFDQMVTVQQFLNRTISVAYPAFEIDPSGRGHVDFSGTENALVLVGPTPVSLGSPGYSRFKIHLDEHGEKGRKVLVDIENARVSGLLLQDELLSDVSNIEFSYFGIGASGQPKWSSEWTSRTTLPELVRIRVNFSDARVWPELIISPRIYADVKCLYDALTKRCQGR